MHKFRYESLKGSIIVVAVALSPAVAFGQSSALAQTIQLDFPFTTTSDTSANANVLIGTPASPIAEASAIESTHSFSAFATGTSTQAYESNSHLNDTFTPNISGLVHLDVVIPDSFGGTGAFWEDLLTMTMGVGTVNTGDSGDFTTGDVTNATETSAFDFPEFLNGGVTGNYAIYGGGTPSITAWQTNLDLSFHAQANIEYEFFTVLQAVSYGNQDATGYCGVDPQWLISTPAGMTYTTSSGFQIQSLATPEPSSFLVAGLGCAGLLIRRRRHKNG